LKLIYIVRLQLFTKESGIKCLILGGKLQALSSGGREKWCDRKGDDAHINFFYYSQLRKLEEASILLQKLLFPYFISHLFLSLRHKIDSKHGTTTTCVIVPCAILIICFPNRSSNLLTI
jgi:hypothetical protein